MPPLSARKRASLPASAFAYRKIVSDMLVGRRADLDLTPFEVARFAARP